jgi:hypothetical protein
VNIDYFFAFRQKAVLCRNIQISAENRAGNAPPRIWPMNIPPSGKSFLLLSAGRY